MYLFNSCLSITYINFVSNSYHIYITVISYLLLSLQISCIHYPFTAYYFHSPIHNMVNTNTFIENKWSIPNQRSVGTSNNNSPSNPIFTCKVHTFFGLANFQAQLTYVPLGIIKTRLWHKFWSAQSPIFAHDWWD